MNICCKRVFFPVLFLVATLAVPPLTFCAEPEFIKDINQSPLGGDPEEYVQVGNTLFFTAEDVAHGEELWKYENNTVEMVKDIYPGKESGGPSTLVAVGNQLYFTAFDGSHGYELWTSDGTETGTYMVKDILTTPDSEHQRHISSLTDVDGYHEHLLQESCLCFDLMLLINENPPGDLLSPFWFFYERDPSVVPRHLEASCWIEYSRKLIRRH